MILSNIGSQAFPCCDFGQAELMAEAVEPFAAGGAGGAVAAMAEHHGASVARSVAIGALTGVVLWYTTRFLSKLHEG